MTPILLEVEDDSNWEGGRRYHYIVRYHERLTARSRATSRAALGCSVHVAVRTLPMELHNMITTLDQQLIGF